MILNILKWLIGSFIVLITIVSLSLLFTGNGYILKAVRTVYLTGHTSAFLEDYKYFENRKIEKGTPQPWPQSVDYNKRSSTPILDSIHLANKSIAYLIIKNDSIWFEKYYDGFNAESKTNSFSMAKSITTSLLGKAIMQGHIKSLDQPISDFYPEYSYAKTTVGDLASMASGLDWVENYTGPFSVTARANYAADLEKTILNQDIVEEPGKSFEYLSGNTQLLGMIIQKATGKTLSNYLSETFWKPMGATENALWELDDDENRLAKAFCCISSNAKDFARFGKLYKDYGKWNGTQLLDSAFVVKSITPRFKESPQYGYGWWMKDIGNKHFFMMRGHLGQYVIVEPNDNVIIVRLGHKKSPDKGVGQFTNDITLYIEEAYKMLENDK